MIVQAYFQSFLESSTYLRFLNELVHTVQDRRHPSVTSEASGSSQDVAELGLEAEVDQFDVDNPQVLWRSRRPCLPYVNLSVCVSLTTMLLSICAFLRMRLGVVDAFGCYISEIDPVPSKSGKIGRTGMSWQSYIAFL